LRYVAHLPSFVLFSHLGLNREVVCRHDVKKRKKNGKGKKEKRKPNYDITLPWHPQLSSRGSGFLLLLSTSGCDSWLVEFGGFLRML
jgi:hypothetical protein